jgi:predicted GNAT superfamily acetyltransferase
MQAVCCHRIASTYHQVMTEFLFRDAVQSDFSAVLTLNEASVRFLSPLDLAKLTRLSKEPVFFRVAVSAATVAGFLLAFLPEAIYDSPNFLWFKARYDNFAYIDRIVVSDAFRGRRLATSLYAELEKYARGRGIPRLVCEINVDPPNPVSLRFHEKEGFIEVGRQEIYEPEKGRAKIVSLQVKELGGVG